jgi:HK97 family phage major capsid protein
MKIKYTIEQAQQLVSDLGADTAEAVLAKSEVVDEDGKAVEFKVKKQTETPAVDTAAIVKEVTDAVRKEIKASIPPIDGGDNTAKKNTVPAQAKRWSSGNLKAFKGADAEFKAYAFGLWATWSLKSSIKGQRIDPAIPEWLANHGIIEKAANGQYFTKAQSESVNSAGGDLVPEEFLPELIRLVESYGVVRANARVRPMTRETLALPRRTGGLTAYFVGEEINDSGTAITKSSVATTKHQLVARKLATYTLESVELVEDAAVSIGDFIAQEIALAFANKEDDCGFNGTGTSTYGHIVGVLPFAGTASTVTAATANTAFSTLDLADFHAVTAKLPQYARANAKWYVSSAGFSDAMERLAYAGGGNTVMNIQGGSSLSFLGYPVVITQVLNSTQTAQTSTKLLAFGDLAMGVTFGDRRSMTIQTDESRHFDTDQVAIKGTERFDIACHTFDSTSAAGPVIVLKTPAS